MQNHKIPNNLFTQTNLYRKEVNLENEYVAKEKRKIFTSIAKASTVFLNHFKFPPCQINLIKQLFRAHGLVDLLYISTSRRLLIDYFAYFVNCLV